MNILYVCHRFPYPPKRGGKIRPFNMIKHLYDEGHQVTVASLVRSEDEAREGEGIQPYCTGYIMERVSAPLAVGRMIARLPTTTPSSMGYFYSPRLKQRISAELKKTKFDLIFVHCSSVAQYVQHVSGIPKMLDFGDMDSQKWLIYSRVRKFPMSFGYWLEGTKLEQAEKVLAGSFDYCTCTTRAELETLESYDTQARTGWFPNGVDDEYFHEAADDYDPELICFVGRMDYFPNQACMFDFCDNTLPLIQAARPAARLSIIGANPSDAVRGLADRRGISVTGSVPDVRPHVHKAAVNVAPLTIARGTQNKILESMSMGVPVVASEQAAGGVDATAGEHFLAASRPEEYRDAVLSLMEDASLRRRFSQAGRERVRSHHNWQHSMSRLDTLIEECVAAVRQ